MSEASSRGRVVVERRCRADIADVWALWTTEEGFESWWGPQGFRVEVRQLEPRVGGALSYDMIADTPEMVAAMEEMGQAARHGTRACFTEFRPRERIVITNVIDFIRGVPAYESQIVVDFAVVGDHVQMAVTLDVMHDDEMTRMQEEGFRSQLAKLDARFDEWPSTAKPRLTDA